MLRTASAEESLTPSVVAWSFSPGEYQRRRRETLAIAEGLGASTVLSFGENRSGLGVTYLTGWPVTRLAAHRLTAHDSRMWVQFHNHAPQARRVIADTEVLDADSDLSIDILQGLTTAATLGSVPPSVARAAHDQGIELHPIDRAHAELRQIKSAEERQALRLGAAASDAGALALIAACEPGATDWDLLAAARSAYTRMGARDHICYIGVTHMDNPDRDVPSQSPEGRVLRQGSVVTFELSAAVAPEYPGQILRTVTLGEPTELYRELHGAAEVAREAVRAGIAAGQQAGALVDAGAVIEEAGFTTTDDLFHGLGMGYLEPIGSSPSRIPLRRPEGTLAAGMSIVVQPNVTTRDHRAGVQTGEMVLVTDDGFEDLHGLDSGLVTLGAQ